MLIDRIDAGMTELFEGELRFPFRLVGRNLGDQFRRGLEAAELEAGARSEELKGLERDSIIAALERANRRISGPGGAAALLAFLESSI